MKKLIPIIVLLWIPLTVSGEGRGSDIARGEIIQQVVCDHDRSQSYSLYLPSAYSTKRSWPVLFTFDPGGRVLVPQELFQKAAEKYGYIVVCLTNSRNGPTAPVVTAMKAVWADVLYRFKVDKKRIYASGFSGGARFATIFGYMVKNPVRGIIGCGAGLFTRMRPQDLKNHFYYGTVGFSDFNYHELRDLDTQLDDQGVKHRIVYFDGDHNWASGEMCYRAIQWMELDAMSKDLLPADIGLIKEVFQAEMSEASGLEKSGNEYWAVNRYEWIISSFQRSENIDELKKRVMSLREGKGYRDFKKKEKKRFNTESIFRKRFNRTFAMIRSLPVRDLTMNKLYQEMALHHLENLQKHKDPYQRYMGNRLGDLLLNQSNQLSLRFLLDKEYKRALMGYRIGEKVGNIPYLMTLIYYNMACCHAQLSNRKEAIVYLKKAVSSGYRNWKHMETDSDLEKIRETREFVELIENMKTTSP